MAFEPERGCAGDIDAALPGDGQLAQLQSRCVAGMQRLSGVVWESSAQGAWRGELKLDALSCVRIGVVGGKDVPAAVQLADADGRVLVQEQGRLPLLVGRDGPVCVRDAGTYRLTARAAGATQASVWLAGR